MKNNYKYFNKEKKIYNFWQKKKLFKVKLNNNKKKNFSIIMPPPNITGNLHIGHAFQQTIIDFIVRYNKMRNKNTLWIMGTDHAGIATQILVENYIKKKKKNCNIISEIWKWKKKYESKIYKQTKLIGSLVDWSKTCFSLDKKFTYAVKTAFIKLYNNKLIYKKKKIVNWDTKIKTVISDLEINKKKKIIKKYFIKFKIFKENKYIKIPFSEPEKILGISIITTNIKNNKFINKYAINPITNKLIKIYYINSKKKKNIYKAIIPAHNKKHYYLSKKKKINIINIYNKDGTINKGIIYTYKNKRIKYLNFYKLKIKKKINYLLLRKKIINYLKKNKKINKIKYKKIIIKYSNKTNSIIIPIITNQWYLKTNLLIKNTKKIIKKNKITIYPKKYKKLFYSWIKKSKDWCISRQIYWGHKIPIWYDLNTKKKYVGYNLNYIKKKYKNINCKNLIQDKNVLDTWFSSSIWTFASLGWPNENKKIKLFHPLNLIVSGFDIIFFWIIRMIMMTSYLIKKNNKLEIPFKKIFITGLIKDENGKKMSKSLGNVINLHDLIKGISLKKLIKKRTKNLIKENKIKNIIKNTKKFFPNGIRKNNIDTIRFTLISIINNTLSINFNINKLIYGYNYCNKLWNISILILNYIKLKNKKKISIKNINKNKLLLIEKWILYKFNNLIYKYNKNIKLLKINLIPNILFKFLKNNFCNWYIEIIKLFKINLNNKIIIFYLFKNLLKISHPIIPFITEYIWKKFNNSSILKKKIIKNIKLKINNNKKNIYIFNIYKKIIKLIRKIKKIKKINFRKLFILNINLEKKKIFLENKKIFKLVNIKKIIYCKIKNFKKINKKKKYNKPILIKKNIYISY